MAYFHRVGVVVAAALLVVGAGAASAGEATSDRTKVSFTMTKGEQGRAVFAFNTDLEDVVAIVVRGVEPEVDVLHVLSDGVPPALSDHLSARATSAASKISGDSLTGAVSVRVQLAQPEPEAYAVEFLRSNGDSVVLNVRPADGQSVSSEFTLTADDDMALLAGNGCYNVDASCSPACSISKECCTRPRGACIDCVKCQITCPPCNLLP